MIRFERAIGSMSNILNGGINALVALIDRLKAAYQNEASRRRLADAFQNDEGSGLLFVSGFDKSGTTWVDNFLDAHPQIICRHSGQFFNYYNAANRYLSEPSGLVSMLDSVLATDWYRNHGRVWITEAGIKLHLRQLIANSLLSFRSPEIQYVGDKSVVQDFAQIRALLPKARLIGIVRDGRDVFISWCFYREWKAGNSRFNPDGSIRHDYLRQQAAAWSEYAEHYHNLRTEAHIIRYEDLSARPRAIMKSVFDRLDVACSSSTLERIVEQTSFKKVSRGRDRGEEDRQSHFRKGVVGDWKNYFSDDDLAIFLDIAGDSLEKWGYIQ